MRSVDNICILRFKVKVWNLSSLRSYTCSMMRLLVLWLWVLEFFSQKDNSWYLECQKPYSCFCKRYWYCVSIALDPLVCSGNSVLGQLLTVRKSRSRELFSVVPCSGHHCIPVMSTETVNGWGWKLLNYPFVWELQPLESRVLHSCAWP